jgi:hypothetical protein
LHLQAHEVNVFVEILRVSLEVSQAKFNLLFLGLETWRNESMDAQRLSLGQSESHALKREKKGEFNVIYLID